MKEASKAPELLLLGLRETWPVSLSMIHMPDSLVDMRSNDGESGRNVNSKEVLNCAAAAAASSRMGKTIPMESD